MTMSTPRSPQGSCGGILHREHLDRSAVDDERVVGVLDGALEGAVGGVVLEQERVRRRVDEVVDGHDLDVGAALDDRLERLATDAAETVDADPDSHVDPPVSMRPDAPAPLPDGGPWPPGCDQTPKSTSGGAAMRWGSTSPARGADAATGPSGSRWGPRPMACRSLRCPATASGRCVACMSSASTTVARRYVPPGSSAGTGAGLERSVAGMLRGDGRARPSDEASRSAPTLICWFMVDHTKMPRRPGRDDTRPHGRVSLRDRGPSPVAWPSRVKPGG